MAARQEKVLNYSESEFYSDGLAMREPPQGTVPRERIVLNPALATGKTMGADGKEAYVTTFPAEGGPPADRARAASASTSPAPPATARSATATASWPARCRCGPPPSLHNYIDRPPGYIYEVITKGFGLMASYAGELPVRERWAGGGLHPRPAAQPEHPAGQGPARGAVQAPAAGRARRAGHAQAAHAPHQEGP
jgi:hypothetical protein